MADVVIVCGSDSDRKVAEKTEETLKELGISFETHIASAHRNPEKVESIVVSHTENGARVFIAVAGLSAALPGVIASQTIRPVIGVPVNVKLDGLDALLSCMQMPPGIPVATVGIDNGKNAALLAAQIIALDRPALAKKLVEARARQKTK